MTLVISVIGYTLIAAAAVIGLSPFILGRRDRYKGKRRWKGWR